MDKRYASGVDLEEMGHSQSSRVTVDHYIHMPDEAMKDRVTVAIKSIVLVARNDAFKFGPNDALVVDVQADILDHLNTTVVGPLLPVSDVRKPAKFLNPIIQIDGIGYVFVAQYLSALSVGDLGEKVTNIDTHFDEITRALGMVFQGF